MIKEIPLDEKSTRNCCNMRVMHEVITRINGKKDKLVKCKVVPEMKSYRSYVVRTEVGLVGICRDCQNFDNDWGIE
ncbi:MAG: hypothetical protein KKD44_27555 [Proteobacteria bacterium]|nr:hypothetical protein [Pseudomonadota bacterium]